MTVNSEGGNQASKQATNRLNRKRNPPVLSIYVSRIVISMTVKFGNQTSKQVSTQASNNRPNRKVPPPSSILCFHVSSDDISCLDATDIYVTIEELFQPTELT